MNPFIPRNTYDPGTTAAASAAKRKADSVELDLTVLERRVDRLALTCQALWELLGERAGVTPQELVDKILEVDMRDGVADGKIATKVIDCPGCGRKVNDVREVCMYCGAPIPHDTIVL